MIGAGFIGGHVAKGLLDAGYETTVVNRSPLSERKERLLKDARVAILDASARALLEPQLADVDHVVYCAGGLMPAESNVDPVTDAALSLPPLLHVLSLLQERPTIGLTFLSSGGTVYGPSARQFIDESHPTEPVTSYGVMKLASEKYVLMHRRMDGAPARVLRCANVYGPHQPATRSQGAVAVFIDRILRGKPVPLYGDGAIVRDFVYVGDVVDVILRALEEGEGSATLNVGSGAGASLAEVIALIERISGLRAVIEQLPARSFDVQRVVLDIARAGSELGFAPMTLEQGLRRTLSEIGSARE
ncbi:MAG: UDP-glucose 4-epimerase [Solirubrobacteraceae bacterium]|nr:UDP-glucose 4-epimerase [Solirubrobacteraceae bacterium]MEA2191324.1 UDP-glucose 4-epimerase [Solirubrobacteraceae bacterium]